MTPSTPEETQGGKRMDIHTIEIPDWIRWLPVLPFCLFLLWSKLFCFLPKEFACLHLTFFRAFIYLIFNSCSSLSAIYHLLCFYFQSSVIHSILLICSWVVVITFLIYFSPSLHWTSISISGKWVLFCVHNFHWV